MRKRIRFAISKSLAVLRLGQSFNTAAAAGSKLLTLTIESNAANISPLTEKIVEFGDLGNM